MLEVMYQSRFFQSLSALRFVKRISSMLRKRALNSHYLIYAIKYGSRDFCDCFGLHESLATLHKGKWNKVPKSSARFTVWISIRSPDDNSHLEIADSLRGKPSVPPDGMRRGGYNDFNEPGYAQGLRGATCYKMLCIRRRIEAYR
jgi:hypothetical protein